MGDRPHLGVVTLETRRLRILESGATKNQATLTHFVKHRMLPAQFLSLTIIFCSDTTLISIDLEALTAVRVECGVLHCGSSSPRQSSRSNVLVAVSPKFPHQSANLNGDTLRKILL